MLKKNQKVKRTATKSLSIALALANSVNTAAPLALPLAMIVPEMPKARQGSVDELLATSFNRGGQLLDYLFFTTAYAETIGTGEATVTKDVTAPPEVDGDVIINGGTQNVYNTGSATNTIVNSGGVQNVSSGGSATNTTVNADGRQKVFNGGTATGTIVNATSINNRGRQDVDNGGEAISTTINADGLQYVSVGGTATNATINGGGVQTIAVGGSGSGTVMSGGDQFVYGSAANTTINSGRQTINNGGTATNTTINGGEQLVSSGTASGTIINSGGEQHVSSGGSAVSATINNGGVQDVRSSGTALDTTVNSGGLQNVLSGGTATGTVINSSGAQHVYQGATASGGTISGANAHQMLYGNSTNVTVNSGGYQSVQDDGIATGTTVSGTGFQEVYGNAISAHLQGGTQIVYADGTATGTDINANGRQTVNSGGNASGTIINNGFQNVSGGGRATSTTIRDGNQTVSSGGQAFYTTIRGGTQEVKDNAKAFNTTISGGNQILSGSSSLAETTVIHNGGTQEVNISALAHRTTINSGGRQRIIEGTALNTTISGGTQDLEDVGTPSMANNTSIYTGGIQNISAGAIATNTTIHSGGVQNVYTGGAAGGTTEIRSDVTLDSSLFVSSGTLFSGGTALSGGTQNVLGGTATGTVIHNGGIQSVSSGTAANTTIHSGGTQVVYRGVNVSNSTVNSGGTINLLQSGASLQGDTTLNQGMIQIVNPASGSYEISKLVINGGGKIAFADHTTIGNRLTLDDMSGAASFVINTDLANSASDKIVVKNSANAAASTIQVAYDPGFAGGVSVNGTAEFASVESGDAGFQPVGTDYGAYRFTPVVSSSTDAGGTHWSITGLTTGSTPGGTPAVSETMHTASDVITGNLAMWRSENNSLIRRMGELRNSTGQTGEWARIYRGELETANPGTRSSKTQYTAIQGGYDTKLATKENGTWYRGYTIGYLDADTGLTRGGGEASSLTVGAYGSWLGDKGHFLDIIAKQGRLKNSYYNYLNDPGNTKVTGSYDNWGSSLSAEYGFRKSGKNSWYWEPQAEISFGRISSASYTASDSTAVHNNHVSSTVGRVGLAIGRNTPAASFYAKASLVREFSAKANVTMSTGGMAPVTLEQNLKDTWLEFALGLTGPVNGRTNGYLEISKTTGDTVKTPWQVNAGLRMSF